MKIKCLACEKEDVLKEIDLIHRSFHYRLFCQDCLKDLKEAEVSNCVECDKPLKKISLGGEYVCVSGPLCSACRDQRVRKARQEGLCILCFVNPQANLIDSGGDKTEFCEECIKNWTKMNYINKLNEEINKKNRRKWD